MDDVLLYASPGKLRRYQLGAAALVVLVPVVALALQLEPAELIAAVLIALSSAAAVVGLEARIRRPTPAVRLSTVGVEGAFGLIRWEDVTAAELLRFLRVRAHGVVLRLRPRTLLHPSDGDFTSAGAELSPGRLELDTRGLDLEPEDLLRAIERFRLYASTSPAGAQRSQ